MVEKASWKRQRRTKFYILGNGALRTGQHVGLRLPGCPAERPFGRAAIQRGAAAVGPEPFLQRGTSPASARVRLTAAGLQGLQFVTYMQLF